VVCGQPALLVFLSTGKRRPENDRKQLGVLAWDIQVDSTVAEQLALVSGSHIVLAIGKIVIAFHHFRRARKVN